MVHATVDLTRRRSMGCVTIDEVVHIVPPRGPCAPGGEPRSRGTNGMADPCGHVRGGEVSAKVSLLMPGAAKATWR